MKNPLQSALVLFFSSSVISQAEVIAQTSFEPAEGFQATGVTDGFSITDNRLGALWKTGKAGTNYAGLWQAQAKSGVNSAVFGSTIGNYILVDPAGSEGVSSIEFSWAGFSADSAGPISIEWTADALNGSETWVPVSELIMSGQTEFETTTLVINQKGDIKLRWVLPEGSQKGISLDDVTVHSYGSATNLVAQNTTKTADPIAPTAQPSNETTKSAVLIGIGQISLHIRE